MCFVFFFFNDTATTEIYTLSLHDALPIFRPQSRGELVRGRPRLRARKLVLAADAQGNDRAQAAQRLRSEEHTSELQSRQYLVCRLLLEKKKIQSYTHHNNCQIDTNYSYYR